MKKLFLLFLSVFSVSVFAENAKTVAVMPTIDRGNVLQSKSYLREAIRMDMEEAVGNTKGFITYDRSAFDAIASERKFQSSGQVKDSEIKALGEMAGVDYVLVCEVTGGDGYIKISSKVMDMVTGQYERVHTSSFVEMSPQAIETEVQKLCQKMFGAYPQSQSSERTTSSTPAKVSESAISGNCQETATIYFRLPSAMQCHYIEINGKVMGRLEANKVMAVVVPAGEVTIIDHYAMAAFFAGPIPIPVQITYEQVAAHNTSITKKLNVQVDENYYVKVSETPVAFEVEDSAKKYGKVANSKNWCDVE